ncbi:MATE family efflux transporter [Marivita sp.]|uniref:MATE family efflux transporter n=1 Tax=Marivita sp. TaxID=2003365 RepID=UPI003426A931
MKCLLYSQFNVKTRCGEGKFQKIHGTAEVDAALHAEGGPFLALAFSRGELPMARADLTKGPVWRALAQVSTPMTFGILAVLSVGLADAYFLGQLGQAPLAAVGFIYPVTTALTSLSIGLSAGTNAVVSQAIGRENEDPDTPVRLALHSLALGVFLAALVALGFVAVAPTLFGWMGAQDAALAETQLYVPFWSLSFPFLVAMMVANAVFRAHGDGATSAVIMVWAAAINIAINPVLIFGWGPVPQMGTEGAALATAIGRGIGAATALWYAWYSGLLTTCGKPFYGILYSFRDVIAVGLPASMSNAINPAGMALVTAAVATLGEAAVAGFGAATRVQSVMLVALFALSAGIGPVVGQNFGAALQDRARLALKQAWFFCVAYGLLLATGVTIFADQIAGFFTDSPEALGYTAQYLRIVSWSIMGYGIVVITNAAMNARSKAAYSLGLSLTRIFILYVPLAWIGMWMFDYLGILLAAVTANMLAIVGSLLCARSTGLVTGIHGQEVPDVLPKTAG